MLLVVATSPLDFARAVDFEVAILGHRNANARLAGWAPRVRVAFLTVLGPEGDEAQFGAPLKVAI